ncbi:hypothetical protein EAG14_04615 [Acidovorax sp. 1608163]|nr:hypothetical protein EAG14_04615 [Acidovorax sp. 1608163]
MGAESRPTAPANAFVRSSKGRAPSAKPVRLDSDTPGYALFLGLVDVDTTPTVEAILDQKKIVLGYNRKPGQTDVLTTVDLRVAETKMVEGEVKRTYSDDTVAEFNQCLGALIERLKSK